LKAAPAAPGDRAAPLAGAERADHQHMRRLTFRLAAASPEQIAAIGWPECPGQLDLREVEQWRDRVRPPCRG
jgi:hypothetical protein